MWWLYLHHMGMVQWYYNYTMSRMLLGRSIYGTYYGGKLMRPTCLSCVKKHIAQAMILFNESKQGYPLHFWWALGHLAEAADECVTDYPELASTIRKVRIQYEQDDNPPTLDELLEGVIAVENASTD